MSKKKVLKTMVFEPGDIIGYDGLSRTVIYVDHNTKIYGLGFENDPQQNVYRWKMSDAHQTYELMPPKHIPQEQHEKFKEMNGRYKNTVR